MIEKTANQIVHKISDAELDRAVDHLRQLHRRYSLAHAIATAQYLVDTFYQGDYELARSRNADAHLPLEELLERRKPELADLDLAGRTLRRYIAAGDVWRGLPEATREHLGVAHLESLAAVSDQGERKRLAHHAATMHWTREQTALAVKDLKKKDRGQKKKPGRKVRPNAVKAVVALKAAIAKVHKGHAAALHLAEAHRMEYLAILAGCQKLLAGLGDG